MGNGRGKAVMSTVAHWALLRQHLGGGRPLHGSSWVATQEDRSLFFLGPGSRSEGLCGITHCPLDVKTQYYTLANSTEESDQHRQRSKTPCSLPSLLVYFYPRLES